MRIKCLRLMDVLFEGNVSICILINADFKFTQNLQKMECLISPT